MSPFPKNFDGFFEQNKHDCIKYSLFDKAHGKQRKLSKAEQAKKAKQALANSLKTTFWD